MKKSTVNPLTLHRETLQDLTSEKVKAAVGGIATITKPPNSCRC